MLEDVKKFLGITGTYQDDTLKVYIEEVKGYLRHAGVSEKNITAGIVSRGVSDLWNYGAGNAMLSPYFKERAAQLVIKSQQGGDENVQT